MNNFIFEIAMEDVRDCEAMHLTIDREDAVKWFSKLEFECAKFITLLTVCIQFKHTKPPRCMINPFTLVGWSILDISKVRILVFHYNTIQKKTMF